VKKTLIALFVLVVPVAFGLGFVTGGARTGSADGPLHDRWWDPLPEELTGPGRPVLEDLRSEDFRLAVVGYGGPVYLVARHCLQGNFDLSVLDRKGRPVYALSNSEAREDCRADYTEFESRGMVKLTFYTWDCRENMAVPWKVEVVHFVAGRAPESSARLVLKPEPASGARLAELAAEARRGLELSRTIPSDSERAKRGRQMLEHSLNRLRNAGLARPDEAIAIFKAMTWADGAAAEAVSEYVEQLEEVKRIRARQQLAK
jgi:hypothetical protein